MTGTRPSLGFGNLFFSVNRHGTVSTASPLWASAILARQQKGLKRRSASIPARSYIVMGMAAPRRDRRTHYGASLPRTTTAAARFNASGERRRLGGRDRRASASAAAQLPQRQGVQQDRARHRESRDHDGRIAS